MITRKELKLKRRRTTLILILSIEVIILILNIDKLINFRNNNPNMNNSPSPEFREIDNYYLNIFSSPFQEISNNLTKTFFPKRSISIKENNISLINQTKKKIKIYHKHINMRWIRLIIEDVKDYFEIEITKDNPDYMIYSVFGCEHLLNKYNSSIKIAFFTENNLPDFTEADYALGFGHLNHLDRYFAYPYIAYLLNLKNRTEKDFKAVRDKVLASPKRQKFCAAVISNPIGFRFKFMKKLNKYKKIDNGGQVHNNIGGPVKNKKEFLMQYKFSIAMENSEADGYASEKIIDSLWAGTIPIYYGDYMIDEYINPKTYILIRDNYEINEKIEYIKRIDNDDKLYRSILKEKVFVDDFFVENITNERKKFFLHIFQQKKEYAKRVDKYHFDYRDK